MWHVIVFLIYSLLSLNFKILTMRNVREAGKLHLDSACKESSADSPGLLDFAIGLVNSVFNLPNGQVIFFEEFE